MSRAYIHEVGLYGVVQGQSPSPQRTALIYECLVSCTKTLSEMLELSLDEMADWGIMEWRSLNLVAMLSTKSSIILDSSYCSPESSSKATWLGKCLDTLSSRAKELHRMAGSPRGQEHFLHRMSTDWTNLKNYHQSFLQKSLAQAFPNQQQSVQPALQAFEFPGDVDPFNDMFWLGIESEAAMTASFQT